MQGNLAAMLEQVPSTWLSVTAKGVRLEQRVDLSSPVPGIAGLEPHCPDVPASSSLLTMDHLPAYHLRKHFHFYKPESGLREVSPGLVAGNDVIGFSKSRQ
jgi:hypothetical protein